MANSAGAASVAMWKLRLLCTATTGVRQEEEGGFDANTITQLLADILNSNTPAASSSSFSELMAAVDGAMTLLLKLPSSSSSSSCSSSRLLVKLACESSRGACDHPEEVVVALMQGAIRDSGWLATMNYLQPRLAWAAGELKLAAMEGEEPLSSPCTPLFLRKTFRALEAMFLPETMAIAAVEDGRSYSERLFDTFFTSLGGEWPRVSLGDEQREAIRRGEGLDDDDDEKTGGGEGSLASLLNSCLDLAEDDPSSLLRVPLCRVLSLLAVGACDDPWLADKVATVLRDARPPPCSRRDGDRELCEIARLQWDTAFSLYTGPLVRSLDSHRHLALDDLYSELAEIQLTAAVSMCRISLHCSTGDGGGDEGRCFSDVQETVLLALLERSAWGAQDGGNGETALLLNSAIWSMACTAAGNLTRLLDDDNKDGEGGEASVPPHRHRARWWTTKLVLRLIQDGLDAADLLDPTALYHPMCQAATVLFELSPTCKKQLLDIVDSALAHGSVFVPGMADDLEGEFVRLRMNDEVINFLPSGGERSALLSQWFGVAD